MKIAYFGIDLFAECLRAMIFSGIGIVRIFTISSGGFDSSEQILSIAHEYGIPVKTERVSVSDLEELVQAGIIYTVTAGYPYRIPVSERLRQLNVHPSLLPVGRGPWPYPRIIMENRPFGVTLHKIMEGFDEGDIVLQSTIEVSESDDQQSLIRKSAGEAVSLLSAFFEAPERYWDSALPQGEGEYWPDYEEKDIHIDPYEEPDAIDRKLRAFYGEGVKMVYQGFMLFIKRGRLIKERRDVSANALLIPVNGGYILAYEWELDLKSLDISDKDRIEAIGKKYAARLYDYNFRTLFCWRKEYDWKVYYEEDMFLIMGEGYFMCPAGEKKAVKRLVDRLLTLYPKLSFLCVDEEWADFFVSSYEGRVRKEEFPENANYIIAFEDLRGFEGTGKLFRNRRQELRKYESLEPAPILELIDEDNISNVKAISSYEQAGDAQAELECIENYFELGFRGILVKRAGMYVGYCIMSELSEDTLELHFMKNIEKAQGSHLFLISRVLDYAGREYKYVNVEDTMGHEGIRHFKENIGCEAKMTYKIYINGEK